MSSNVTIVARQIIVSAQPLRSLSVVWRFSSVGEEFLARHVEAQEEMEDEEVNGAAVVQFGYLRGEALREVRGGTSEPTGNPY